MNTGLENGRKENPPFIASIEKKEKPAQEE